MRVMILGDHHLPWPLWAVLEEAARFEQDYKPDVRIITGDLIDAHNWSRFQRHPDSPSAQQEWEATIDSAARLYKTFDTDTWSRILLGNHDLRILARAYDANIPSALIRPFSEVFPYENWKWHTSPDMLKLDGVYYDHGDGTSGTTLAKAKELGAPYVHGHEHKEAKICYSNLDSHQTWGMHVGWVGDRHAIAMRYSRRNYRRGWLGWATVTDGGCPQLWDYTTMKRFRRRGTTIHTF